VIILFPFHPGDQRQAEQWMAWTEELGAGRNHSIILMPAKQVADFEVIRQSAIRAFQKVDVLKDAEGINGHPDGPNAMMRQAVWHMHTSNLGPWMFCEPDNILLTPDALDVWEREYRAYGKPFMGELRPAHDFTPDYLTGNMMLPKDALFAAPMLGRRGLSKEGVELAFDIVAASQTLPQAHLTKLLQQVPKPRDGEGHTFPGQDSLKILRDGAVMFHPCKDGTLIQRLREKRSGVALLASAPAKSGDKVELPPLTPAAPISERDELLARIARLEALLSKQGGDEQCAEIPELQTTISTGTAWSDKVASNAAPTSKPAARRKHSPKRRKRPPLTEEHKAKLREAWKARKAMA
jgi:hypothetical protein